MTRKEIALGNVIKDIAAGPFGSNLKVSCFVEDGFPIIDGANLKGYKVTDNITKFVTEEKARSLSRSIARRNDVIVTISGTLGQISYIPEDSKYEEYLCSQRQFRVSFDSEKVYVPYLVFYFHTYEGQHKILSFANQTGVPALAQPLKNFRQIRIDLPDIDEQKRIAAVIESLNDKIELNERINKNLEEQIQLLYKQIFLSEGSARWKYVPLSELIFFQEGPGIRNWQYVSDGVRFINIRCINNGFVDTTTANMISEEEAYGKYAHFLLKPFDIVMSCSGTLGRYAIIQEENLPLCLNTSVIRFRPNKEAYDYAFVFGYITSDEFLNQQAMMANGSAQVNFGPTHLRQIMIKEPPQDIRKKFNDLCMPMIKTIISKRAENLKLTSLRDNLLPRLMSGELRV